MALLQQNEKVFNGSAERLVSVCFVELFELDVWGGTSDPGCRLRAGEDPASRRSPKKGQTGTTDVAVRVLLSRCIRQLETLLQDVKPTR